RVPAGLALDQLVQCLPLAARAPAVLRRDRLDDPLDSRGATGRPGQVAKVVQLLVCVVLGSCQGLVHEPATGHGHVVAGEPPGDLPGQALSTLEGVRHDVGETDASSALAARHELAASN